MNVQMFIAMGRRPWLRAVTPILLVAGLVQVPANQASASGVAYGRPASCAVKKLCLYNSANFVGYLGAFEKDNSNWNGSNAKNADTSAYNAGSVGWDVKVFPDDNWGGGFYCLKPGRGWANLADFPGANNNGQSNDWVQNFCS